MEQKAFEEALKLLESDSDLNEFSTIVKNFMELLDQL